jgi:hypothetical protein
MRLFYQNHSWAGATLVVAPNEEEARRLFRAYQEANPVLSHYQEEKPIESAPVGQIVDIYGDR